MTLRELLTHRKTTQAEIARRLGVSQAMVSKWVSGARNPKYETVNRISDALDAVPLPPQSPGENWDFRPVKQIRFEMGSAEDATYYIERAEDIIQNRGFDYLTTNETLHAMRDFVQSVDGSIDIVVRKGFLALRTDEPDED